MTPLIDGDIIVYRAACAAQRFIYKAHESAEVFESWKAAQSYIEMGGAVEKELIVDPVHFALHNAKKMIATISSRFDDNEPMLFLTETNDETSFRKKIAKTRGYKESRKKQSRPMHYEEVRRYIKEKYNASVTKGYEADDALAVCHTANKENTVICTIDKDLLQVPGRHYHIVAQTCWEIDELTGAKNLFTQILQGDTADDVPGCPGIGKVKAHKYLENCTTIKEMYDTIVGCYDECPYEGDKQELMLEMANLVFIFREKGITFTKWVEKYL